MMTLDFINKMNIWTFFAMTMAIIFIVAYFSYLWGKKARAIADKISSEVISNNILGLLALILGFSFSMAVNRYDVRRELAIREANAIGTAYLRSSLINFEQPDQVKELFKRYVDLRIEVFDSTKPKDVIYAVSRVQDDLWREVKTVTKKDRGELESSFVESLNEMFDTGNARNFALIKMLPASFYLLILILAATAVGIMSFDRGYKQDTGHLRSIIFILLFGMVFSFIFDMDHYKSGLIQLGQDSLLLVRRSM